MSEDEAENILVAENERLRAEVERLRGVVKKIEHGDRDSNGERECFRCGAKPVDRHDPECDWFTPSGGVR